MRPLFVLLLCANIGFFAWQYQAHGGLAGRKAAVDEFRATDPGVPPLVLLNERGVASPAPPASGAETLALLQPKDAEKGAGLTLEPMDDAMPDEAAAAEQRIEAAPAPMGDGRAEPAPIPGDDKTRKTGPATSRYCFELGPYPDRPTMERLQTEARRAGGKTDLRERTETVADGYWIRLPEYLSYDQARARYRELQKKGMEDIAIVPLPDKRYFISLGVYKRKDTVEDRRKEILASGISPAIEERMVSRTAYVLAVEYEGGAESPPRKLRQGLAARAPQIPVRETECR
ncbi:MAG: SPOR domain-containing protein [Gammaproteobacteria bacterium]|nr:SPOR domain-containing protein [Gammaproteobacteria bacterium]